MSLGIDCTQTNIITRLCMLGNTSSGLPEFFPKLGKGRENDTLDPVYPCADSIFCDVEKAGK